MSKAISLSLGTSVGALLLSFCIYVSKTWIEGVSKQLSSHETAIVEQRTILAGIDKRTEQIWAVLDKRNGR